MMPLAFRLVILSGAIGFFVGCSGDNESKSANDGPGAALDRVAQDARDRTKPEEDRLIAEAHDLWNRGMQQQAIDKYAEVIRLNSANAYGHFGLGMQFASQPPASRTSAAAGSEPRFSAWGPANASLRMYLDSNVDTDQGAGAERRARARSVLSTVEGKLAKDAEDADGFELHEGLRRVKQGDRWGFADQAGRMVINPTFELERNFSEGLAPVRLRGKWGYIDRTGRTVIEPQFLDALDFKQGIAQVRREGDPPGMYRFIDRAGRPARNPDYR